MREKSLKPPKTGKISKQNFPLEGDLKEKIPPQILNEQFFKKKLKKKLKKKTKKR
jgi:hypothetical protein